MFLQFTVVAWTEHTVLIMQPNSPKTNILYNPQCVRQITYETQNGRRKMATGMRWNVHMTAQGASEWLMSFRKTFKSSLTFRCVSSLSSCCQHLIPSSSLPSFHPDYRKQTHNNYTHIPQHRHQNCNTHSHRHKYRMLQWQTWKLEGENWGRTPHQTKDS